MRPLLASLALLCLPALADESVPEPVTPPAALPLVPMPPPIPIDYGVLTVSRERLEVSTPCDIGLYLQGNLAARLYQGQSVTLNLPPGEVRVRLGQLGGEHCQPRFEQLRSQTLRIDAGTVSKYRIAMDALGLQLIPAPLSY
ncbi:hypothetical protein AAFN46_02710 [Pseudomonas sp. CAU 1711]|uniref:hypothetical protein n=1 Tax=Pseudomonas sp. CAU 1711 TaxID=3140356 RepID=UPI0032619D3A